MEAAVVEDWEQKYLDLLAEVVGPGGSTCTRHQQMSNEEWLRRQWKNALNRWRFWKQSYELISGKVPVTLEMRAENWEKRAHWLEALCDEHGINYREAELKLVADALKAIQ